jgi:Na+-translocating ferredoxin:NAD+ oxidoreductase subunit B
MSEESLYRQLQHDLDRMPVGFPPTESGVELRILRQLFAPLEARIALCLGMMLEPLSAIHKRFGDAMDSASFAAALEAMDRHGLIRSETGSAEPRYAKLPFVVGIYEGQVDRLTEELARDLIEYFDGGLGPAIRPKATPQLRTVPVNKPIPVERLVSRYDDIRASVESSPGPFAVMNCICRQARDLVGEPCRQTAVRENCLTMESAATVMLDHGQARPISRERMLELLDDADREGLVLQPQNTRNPMFICCCCGCCCVSIRAGKRIDKPVEFFSTNYFASVEEGTCSACGTCADRCPMEAISVQVTVAAVDRCRCIGCGLCVSTCPSGSVKLLAKPDPAPTPAGTEGLYARIYRERYGTAGLALAALRSVGRRITLP